MEVCVSVPASVMVGLVSEVMSSPGDTDGWLLGSWSTNVVRVYSDEREGTTSRVQEVVLCDVALVPRLDAATAMTQTVSHTNTPDWQVVGWLSARRESPLRPSLRERACHRCLIAGRDTPFLFLLFSISANPSRSLRAYDYRLFASQTSELLCPVSLAILTHPTTATEYTAFHTLTHNPHLSKFGAAMDAELAVAPARHMEGVSRRVVTHIQSQVTELLELDAEILAARSRVRELERANKRK